LRDTCRRQPIGVQSFSRVGMMPQCAHPLRRSEFFAERHGSYLLTAPAATRAAVSAGGVFGTDGPAWLASLGPGRRPSRPSGGPATGGEPLVGTWDGQPCRRRGRLGRRAVVSHRLGGSAWLGTRPVIADSWQRCWSRSGRNGLLPTHLRCRGRAGYRSRRFGNGLGLLVIRSDGFRAHASATVTTIFPLGWPVSR